MNWKPILNKNKDAKLFSYISSVDKYMKDSSLKENGLVDGNAGLSIYYFYLSKFLNNKMFLERSKFLLEKALLSLEENEFSFDFATGLSGILWAYNHLNNNGLTPSNEISNQTEINNYCEQFCNHAFHTNNLDVFYGSIGTNILFLEQNISSVLPFIENSIKKLNYYSIDDHDSVKWENHFMKATSEIDLGIPHGICGILNFLSICYERNIDRSTTLPMINGCINFLMRHRNPPHFYSSFPNKIGDIYTNSRLAWCYGDLSIGISIFNAGISTKNGNWTKLSVDILKKTCLRTSFEETNIIDSGICHGSFGIAHLYNQLYQRTDIEVFRQSSVYWFYKYSQLETYDETCALKFLSNEKGSCNEDLSLLTGSSGIELTLISAFSNIPPLWDRCLLIS